MQTESSHGSSTGIFCQWTQQPTSSECHVLSESKPPEDSCIMYAGFNIPGINVCNFIKKIKTNQGLSLQKSA